MTSSQRFLQLAADLKAGVLPPKANSHIGLKKRRESTFANSKQNILTNHDATFHRCDTEAETEPQVTRNAQSRSHQHSTRSATTSSIKSTSITNRVSPSHRSTLRSTVGGLSQVIDGKSLSLSLKSRPGNSTASSRFIELAKALRSPKINPVHATVRDDAKKSSPKSSDNGRKNHGFKHHHHHHHAFTPSQSHQKQSENRFIADFLGVMRTNERSTLGSVSAQHLSGFDTPEALCTRKSKVEDDNTDKLLKKKSSEKNRKYIRQFSVNEMVLGLGEAMTTTTSTVSKKGIINNVQQNTARGLSHLSMNFLREHAKSHPAVEKHLKNMLEEKNNNERTAIRRRALAMQKQKRSKNSPVHIRSRSDYSPLKSYDGKKIITNDADVKSENESEKKNENSTHERITAVENTHSNGTNVKSQTLLITILLDANTPYFMNIDLKNPTKSIYDGLRGLNELFFDVRVDHSRVESVIAPRSFQTPRYILYSGLGGLTGYIAPMYDDMTKLRDFQLNDESVIQILAYFAAMKDAARYLVQKKKQPTLENTKVTKMCATGMYFGKQSFGSTPKEILDASISLVGSLLNCAPQHIHLRTLVLDNQCLTDEVISPLFSVLHKLSVRNISLRHNNITKAGVHIIARCILRIQNCLDSESELQTAQQMQTWGIFRVDLIGNNRLGVEAAKVLAGAILLRKHPNTQTNTELTPKRQNQHQSSSKHNCEIAALYTKFGVEKCAPIQILLGHQNSQAAHASIQHIWHRIIPIFGLPHALLRHAEAVLDDQQNTMTWKNKSSDGNNFATDAAILGYLYSAGEARRDRLAKLNTRIAVLVERLGLRGATFSNMEKISKQITNFISEAKNLAAQLELTEKAIWDADVEGLDKLCREPQIYEEKHPRYDSHVDPSFDYSESDLDTDHNSRKMFKSASSHVNEHGPLKLERSIAMLDLANGRRGHGSVDQRQYLQLKQRSRRQSVTVASAEDRKDYKGSAAHHAAQELDAQYPSNSQEDQSLYDVTSALDKLAEERLHGGSYASAVQVFERAIAIARSEWQIDGQLAVGSRSRQKLERLVKGLTRLADILLSHDHCAAEAAGLYNETLPYIQKLRGLEHTDVARILDRLAAALCLQLDQLSLGQPGNMHVGYSEPALKFCDMKLLPPTCERLNRKIEYICLWSLRIRENHHRYLEAQRAIGIDENTTTSGPEMFLINQMLIPLQQLGVSYLRIGDLDRAEMYLQRALKLSQRHYNGSLIHPTHSQGQSSFGGTPRDGLCASNAMQLIALLRVQQKRYPEAVAILRRSLHIRKITCGTRHAATAQTMLMLGVLLHAYFAQHGSAEKLLANSFDIFVEQATLAQDVVVNGGTKHKSSFESFSDSQLMRKFLEALDVGNNDPVIQQSLDSKPMDKANEILTSDKNSLRNRSRSRVTIDDESEWYFSPHSLLLNSPHTARSLRTLVYDSCVWRARVAARLGKPKLAQQLFSFGASIAAAQWHSKSQSSNVLKSPRDNEQKCLSRFTSKGQNDEVQSVINGKSSKQAKSNFAARGWETGQLRSWERREYQGRHKNNDQDQQKMEEVKNARKFLHAQRSIQDESTNHPHSWYDSNGTAARRFFQVDHQVREAEATSDHQFESWAPDISEIFYAP